MSPDGLSMDDVLSRVETARKAAQLMIFENRPRQWVAREMGLSEEEVHEICRFLGFGRRHHMLRLSLEEYDQIENAIEEQWSSREIMRTFNISATALRRWFPYYRGWGPGSSEQSRALQFMKGGYIK